MKRFSERDDVYMTSRTNKRPRLSSNGECSAQTEMFGESSTQRVTTNDSLSYLKAVRDVFLDSNGCQYKKFLDVTIRFQKQSIGVDVLIQTVKELFKGHPELILGFNIFLPKGYEITLPSGDKQTSCGEPNELAHAISFVNKIKKRFQGDGHVYKFFLDIVNMYRNRSKSICDVYRQVSILFREHLDLLYEFTQFLPDTSGTTSLHFPQSNRNLTFHDGKINSPMTPTRPIRVQKKATASHAYQDTSFDRPDPVRDKGVIRFAKEKSQYGNEEKERRELRERELFGHDRSLRISQKHKLPRKDEESVIDHYHQVSESLRSDGYGSVRVEYNDRDCEKDDQERDRANRDRHIGVACGSKDVSGSMMTSLSNKDKFRTEEIQELDLSICKKCTPSYRVLPKNGRVPSVNQGTRDGSRVLNDRCLSITKGSEDRSFKHIGRNRYEEILFRCEDDRFEMDMLLESFSAAIKRVEELLEKINDNTIRTDTSICLEDHFTAFNLHCIERIYGDHGLVMMDALRKNVPRSLPFILTRLKQKQEECVKCLPDFNKFWAEVCAKNYHKSLDHRSFYLKQKDSTRLSRKALLDEIKEISEKQQKEANIYLSNAAGNGLPIVPNMEFEYLDSDIHEYLYQLIKCSCRKIGTTDQSDKVMEVWRTFLEPMLGVPSHAQCVVGIEDFNKMNGLVADILVPNIVESDGCLIEVPGINSCKQLNPSRIGDENTIPENSRSSRAWLVCCNNGVKEDIFHDQVHDVHKSEALCKPCEPGEVQINVLADATSRISRNARAACSSISVAVGVEESHGRSNNDYASGLRDNPLQSGKAEPDGGLLKKVPLLAEGSNFARPVSSFNEATIEKSYLNKKYDEKSFGYTEIEREEGELSPNGYFEEATFHGQSASDVETHNTKDGATRMLNQNRLVEVGCEEGGVENYVAKGEESTHISSDPNEHSSEKGDASASESADGYDCSHEEREGHHEEHDTQAGTTGEAGRISAAHDIEGDGRMSPFSEFFLRSMEPFRMRVPPLFMDQGKDSQIFYGNDSFYILFRLHQALYERIKNVKSSAEEIFGGSTDLFARCMNALCNLLKGSSDNVKFEDVCQAMMGNQSYVLLTIENLVHKLVKQLRKVATDELESKLLELYAYEKSRTSRSFVDMAYNCNARILLPKENIYRIKCWQSCGPLHLSIQLMDFTCANKEAISLNRNFLSYINNDFLSLIPGNKEKPGVVLKRNKRKFAEGDELADT